MKYEIIQGDCLDVMRGMEAGSVDLVMTSPPYEDCRTYGIEFNLRDQAYVDWCAERFRECLRVSKGLVAWVIEGKTRRFRYSATPILLMSDLHRSGVHLRKPPVFYRNGISGSGGTDWLKNNFEFIICATNGGKLHWSDNTACGSPCKFPPGGRMSHRTKSGKRTSEKVSPKEERLLAGELPEGSKTHTKNDGDRMRVQVYTPPEIANPGNVLKFDVGGGRMGHQLAHENEAPYPLGLAEFFIKSFCPPNGTVLDPFGGSATTAHAAWVNGRNSISIDVRESQCELMKRRMGDVVSKSQASSLKEFESLWK